MHRLHFLILVWLLGCGAACTETHAQPRLYGCPRDSIEAYPGEEKRPVLQFLDEARAPADRSMQLFAAGRLGELYAGISTLFRKEHTEKGFSEMLGALEQREGKVLEYEYRDQYFSYSDPSVIDLQKVTSVVRYAVKTTKREDGAFLEVRTARQGREQVVVQIEMGHFSQDFPAELRYPKAPRESVCFGKGRMNVKAPE